MNLKLVLTLVAAIAAGSAVVIMFANVLGIESVIPGVIGTIAGVVVVALSADKASS